MASGIIKKVPPINDFEGTAVLQWNGTQISFWRNGNVSTLVWNGHESAATSTGAKDVYMTIPEKYRPRITISTIFTDQNNKRFFFLCSASGQAGLHYQLDPITDPTGVYGTLTWVSEH